MTAGICMPYTYHVDRARGIVHVTGSGTPTFAESAATIRALAEDPSIEPTDGLLVDMRAAVYTPSRDETRDFGHLFGDLRSRFRGRIAIVVRDQGRAAIAGLVSLLVELRGVSMQTFVSVAEAETWLGAADAGER
jgi:hypothetical protein